MNTTQAAKKPSPFDLLKLAESQIELALSCLEDGDQDAAEFVLCEVLSKLKHR